MKQKFLLALICLLSVFSCKKEQSLQETNQSQEKVISQNVNNELISEVVHLSSYDERKSAYSSMLNNYEKFTLWSTRINDVLGSKSLNNAQLILFKELKDKAVLTLFTDSLQHDKMASYFEDWRYRAKQSFTPEQIKYLLTDVVPFNKNDFAQLAIGGLTSQAEKYKTLAAGDCVCSRSSDYCNDLEGDCVSSNCTSGGHCGTFLVYTCNGYCSLMIKPN